MRVDQLLAGFADGDAISHHAKAIRDILTRWGIASDLFVEPSRVSHSMRPLCRPLDDYRGAVGDVVIYHYSIHTPATDVFKSSAARKIFVYHNITPAEFYCGFQDDVRRQLAEARQRLAGAVAGADAWWAVSEYNARELRGLECDPVRVFPLLLDPARLDIEPDKRVLDRFSVKQTTILHVGRIAPNKRIETLLEAFYWYFKTINPFSRLVIVGSERSCPRYYAMLQMMVGDLDLPSVGFEHFASPEGLPSYYRAADLLVSTSEHEGYGMPLLEAMYLNVPVLARAAGGVPEAMDNAGVLFEDLEPVEIAGLMDRILSDDSLREEILSSQRARIERLRKRDVERELKTLLTEAVAGFSVR